MKRYFSPSTMGFYSSDVHSPEQIPEDAREITEEVYKNAAGKAIELSGGIPVPIAPPTPEIQALSILAIQAQKALNDSDIVVIRCAEHAVAVPDGWKAYRQELRDIISGRSAATTVPIQPENYPEGT